MPRIAVYQWKAVGEVMIACFTAGQIPNETWDAYVTDLREKPVTRSLGLGLGTFELTSLQRKSAADVAKAKQMLSSVVTDDKLVRGIVTVGSWLGATVKAFSWAELRDAVVYLKIPAHRVDSVISEGMALRSMVEGEERKSRPR